MVREGVLLVADTATETLLHGEVRGPLVADTATETHLLGWSVEIFFDRTEQGN